MLWTARIGTSQHSPLTKVTRANPTPGATYAGQSAPSRARHDIPSHLWCSATAPSVGRVLEVNWNYSSERSWTGGSPVIGAKPDQARRPLRHQVGARHHAPGMTYSVFSI